MLIHQPKWIAPLICLITLVACILLILSQNAIAKQNLVVDRNTRIETMTTLYDGAREHEIIVDHNTGVMYLSSQQGLCVMVDANGNPLIWQE